MKTKYLLLIGFYLLVYIAPLGVRPLISQDETRYAEISREMVESGDWVVPRLNGLRYFEKPVMGYWLNAVSIKLFGENAFAVRFPSAVAAGLSAWMIFFMVRRFSRDDQTALLSVMVFLTSFFVFCLGVYSVLDSMFTGFLTGALISFFYAYNAGNLRKKTAGLTIFGVFTGFAFMTKGFLGFAIPVIVIGPFLLWERRVKEMFILPWLPFFVAVAVITPWAVLIHVKEPDFWNYFFWTENIQRFASDDAQHKESVFYYIKRLPAIIAPWTVLLPSAFQGFQKKHFQNPLIRYAACWFIFPFLFFTASEGKLLTYILPCLPAVAILVGFGLKTYLEGSKYRTFKYGSYATCFLTALLAVGLVVIQVVGCNDKWPYCHDSKWIIVVLSLSVSAILFFTAGISTDRQRKIIFFMLAPMSIMFGAHFAIPNSVLPSRAPGDFLLMHKTDVTPETIIISDQKPFQAVCWFFKRNDLYLLENSGEASYGISHEDSTHRLLNLKDFKKLIELNSGRILLIVSVERYEKIKQVLPEPHHEDNNGRIVMAWF